MSETWFELLRDHRVIGMACGTLIAVVAIIASQVRRCYTAKMEADLKRDMVSRGRSAEEIERILSAKQENGNTWEACILTQQSRPGQR